MVPSLVRHAPPPPDYYASNLRLLLETVHDRSGDLLTDTERAFVQALLGASRPAQRLFARLVSRTGRWVRVDTLDYPEVGDSGAALDELVAAGLAEHNPRAPAEALLGLLTRPELALLFPRVQARTKPAWIAGCVSRYPDDQIRARIARQHPWTGIGFGRAFAVCQVLFFGGDRQDLSAFVLQDLGVLRYEPYAVSPETRAFGGRGELDRYLLCRRLAFWAERLDDIPQLASSLRAALTPPPLSRIEQRVRDKVLNRVGRWCERRADWPEALRCYELATSHPARERRARIHQRLGDADAVTRLLAAMRADPWAPEEEDFVTRFPRPRRRGAGGADGAAGAGLPLSECRLEGPTPPAIERHAMALLTAGGGTAWHLENQLPLGLAGLAFWPEIFAPVKGAFSHPFQVGPRDLFWPDFARARQQQLAERLRALAPPGAFAGQVREVYGAKHGTANRLVHWGLLTPEVIDVLLAQVPEPALLRLASYTLHNLGRARAGFPDLLVVYGPGAWELVEVKGPTDQLQPAQRVWLQALADLGLPARVLKFRSPC